MTERRWSCGCLEVDGVLVRQCTQSKTHGEMSAEQHAQSQPFSVKCFRLGAIEAAKPAEPVAEPVAPQSWPRKKK